MSKFDNECSAQARDNEINELNAEDWQTEASSPSVAKGEPGTMTAREPQEPDPDYLFVEQNTFDADDPGPGGQMYDRHGNPIPAGARDEIVYLRAKVAFAAEQRRGLEQERDAAVVVLRAKCSESEWATMPEQFRAAESRLREREEQIAKAIECLEIEQIPAHIGSTPVGGLTSTPDVIGALAALRKE